MTASLAPEGPAVRPTSWQQVTLILGLVFGLLGATTALAVIHADVAAILNAVLAVVVLVLTALGYDAKRSLEGKMDTVQGGVQSVKEISNGRLTEALEMSKKLQDQINELQKQNTALALQIQPPTPPDPATPVSPAAP